MYTVTRTSGHIGESSIIAYFDFEVAGLTITGCGLRRGSGGIFVAVPPRGFSRPKTRTVAFGPEARAALDEAGKWAAQALDLDDADDDEGLRRVIRETMRKAGL